MPTSPRTAARSAELLQNLLGDTRRRFDKGGEAFYDQISALHKSVRGSNPDAALYWFAAHARQRLRPCTSPGGWCAWPRGGWQRRSSRPRLHALSAWDVQERLGDPEGELTVAQAIVYLACAPKSNAVYSAFNAAMRTSPKRLSREVPLHSRNAADQIDEEPRLWRGIPPRPRRAGCLCRRRDYFPEDLEPRRYYQPVPRAWN
ncbi:hypothetical protein ACPA9J_00250 [Pseudomonas aeruginosa]